MKIIYKGKQYEWYDGEELHYQPQDTQDIFNLELKNEFELNCIEEKFETTGNSVRIINKKNLWKNYLLRIEYIYEFPATHEKNGIIKQLNYYLYEQVD